MPVRLGRAEPSGQYCLGLFEPKQGNKDKDVNDDDKLRYDYTKRKAFSAIIRAGETSRYTTRYFSSRNRSLGTIKTFK